MNVANPIYDVVFKYLLDDEKVAKAMLSGLLGKEVLALQFRPTELHHVPDEQDGNDRGPSAQLLVLRMDFAATIRLEDGSHKLILIEVQKARNAWDVQRFRRYLGANYSNQENVYLDPKGKRRPLPIMTIYFLGEGLDQVDVPVLRINRHYLDVATGAEVRITDPFVEALTHDSIVVQVNRLKAPRRTELEGLLEVFDQGQASRLDPHVIEIMENNFPVRYQQVLRRLTQAAAEKEVREWMIVEDEMLAAYQDMEREAADLHLTLVQSRQVLAEKDHVLAEKDQALAEKDRTLAEKDQALAAKDRALAEIKQAYDELKRLSSGRGLEATRDREP